MPMRFLDKAFPYKYIVYKSKGKNQKIHWEYSEFCNDCPGDIVRDLVLMKKNITKNGNYETSKTMHTEGSKNSVCACSDIIL